MTEVRRNICIFCEILTPCRSKYQKLTVYEKGEAGKGDQPVGSWIVLDKLERS